MRERERESAGILFNQISDNQMVFTLIANKLALNVSKTKFMVFHTRNKSVKYPSLLINGKLIERVTQFIFLALILESSMSWNLHINHISLKISKAIVYNTLILPYFNYCILVWGATINEGNPLHLFIFYK